MKVRCQCNQCQSLFRIDAEYVGRKVRCPKCTTVMTVPAEAPVDERSAEPSMKPVHAAPPAVERSAPNDVPLQIRTDDRSLTARAVSRKGWHWSVWLALGCTLLLIAGSIATWGLFRILSGRPATVVVRLPDIDRSELGLRIDGEPSPIDASDPLVVQLSPGTHELVLHRRGHVAVEHSVTLRGGQQIEITADWPEGAALPAGELGQIEMGEAVMPHGYEAWLQDWEKARQTARDLGHPVLAAFVSSDSDPASQQLQRHLFATTEFAAWANDQVVLLVIDFPHTPAGERRVLDLARNGEIAVQYSVYRTPTLLWIDSDGRPFGRREELDNANWQSFQEMNAEVHEQRSRYQTALRDAMSELGSPTERLGSAVFAVQWIMEQGAGTFYSTDLKLLADLGNRLDGDNNAGKHELLYAAWWETAVDMAMDNRRKADCLQLVAAMRAWRGTREIKDSDVAVRIHLMTAGVLASYDEVEQARDEITAAAKHNPQNAELAARLQQAATLFSGTLSTGTGFVVASGGYVLTNNHVVDGPGKVQVRLSERGDAVAATIVASDVDRDMALLKIDDPRGESLPAVEMRNVEVGRGVAVATLGYPLGTEMGNGLKLTQGTISSLPDVASDSMYLLDMRVNPGNSGGPLCDSHGQVIGMITAKSMSDAEVESYGMALPSSAIVSFLQEHIPTFSPMTSAATETLDWAQVDRRVSPSVIMVMMVE